MNQVLYHRFLKVKALLILKEVEVVEVAIEVEGSGRGRGGLILCYWCRDFLPKEQANQKVAQCPYQNQAKNDWWKNQLGSVQGDTLATQPDNKEN